MDDPRQGVWISIGRRGNTAVWATSHPDQGGSQSGENEKRLCDRTHWNAAVDGQGKQAEKHGDHHVDDRKPNAYPVAAIAELAHGIAEVTIGAPADAARARLRVNVRRSSDHVSGQDDRSEHAGDHACEVDRLRPTCVSTGLRHSASRTFEAYPKCFRSAPVREGDVHQRGLRLDFTRRAA